MANWNLCEVHEMHFKLAPGFFLPIEVLPVVMLPSGYVVDVSSSAYVAMKLK